MPDGVEVSSRIFQTMSRGSFLWEEALTSMGSLENRISHLEWTGR